MHVEIMANALKDKFYIKINLQILTNNWLCILKNGNKHKDGTTVLA